jgi:ParB/RepB/Spo0J family partition protein
MDEEPGVQRIPLSELHGDASQPRHGEGDRKALEALKTSLHELGRTVQYVTVSPSGEHSYRIVSGHRRVQAARELGWDWLPVIVVDDVADDIDRQLRQIAENSARAALRPIELCEAIDRLRGRVEPPRIAGATGVSLRTVYNYLGILEHPDLVERLRAGVALRSILSEVAGRNQGAAAEDVGDSPEQDARARQRARRTARRSIARLRESWAHLEGSHRRELAGDLHALLEAIEAAEPAPDSATLHSSQAGEGQRPAGPLLAQPPAGGLTMPESPIEGEREPG